MNGKPINASYRTPRVINKLQERHLLINNMEADNMEAMEAAGVSVTEKPTNGSVHLDLDLEDDDLNQPPEVSHRRQVFS
ncbi:hypothetical protein Tco_1469385 [Tanacetum coccineum]